MSAYVSALAQLGKAVSDSANYHHQSEQAEKARAHEAELFRKNAALQTQFAKKGIRWRVADAKAAGLHPLAALGGGGAQFTPLGQAFVEDPNPVPLAESMGQNISRAVQATMTRDERMKTKAQELELENMSLHNDLLRSQVLASQREAIGPPLPSAVDASIIPGQGNAYVVKPAEAVASSPGRPAQEAGAISSYGFARTPTGLSVVQSADAKQRTEDDLMAQVEWAVRNKFIPALSGLPAPDSRQYPLPRGFKKWKWDPWAQEFRPSR